MAIVIDTPEGIEHYRMCAAIASLKMEIKTGMRMSKGISVLTFCQRTYGVTARTKAKALREMLQLYKETYGMEYNDGK